MSAATEDQDPFRPLHKEVLIEKPLAEVFDFFTQINKWWPLASHSMGRKDSGGLHFPGKAGLEISESVLGGPSHLYGRVKQYEKPDFVIFSWHPGRPPAEATEVEVRFTSKGPDLTRVHLIHRGWAVLAGEPVNWRSEYDKAWDFVFAGCFAAACRDI